MRFLCLVFCVLFHFRLESHQPKRSGGAKGVEKLKLPHTCTGRAFGGGGAAAAPIRKFFSFVEESDKENAQEKCIIWATDGDDETQKGATA